MNEKKLLYNQRTKFQQEKQVNSMMRSLSIKAEKIFSLPAPGPGLCPGPTLFRSPCPARRARAKLGLVEDFVLPCPALAKLGTPSGRARGTGPNYHKMDFNGVLVLAAWRSGYLVRLMTSKR